MLDFDQMSVSQPWAEVWCNLIRYKSNFKYYRIIAYSNNIIGGSKDTWRIVILRKPEIMLCTDQYSAMCPFY